MIDLIDKLALDDVLERFDRRENNPLLERDCLDYV